MKQAATYSQLVGLVLRWYRKKDKLKQADLAKTVGVTASVWSRIESGRINLHIAHLDRACEELGIWASEILDKSERLRERMESEAVGVRIIPGEPGKAVEGDWIMLGNKTLQAIVEQAATDLLPPKT